MIAEIIIIGDEILYGLVKEENSYIIIRQLTSMGIFVSRVVIIRDDEKEIMNAVKNALERKADLIVTTGGLGPTEDDKTLDTIAKLLGKEIIYNEEIVKKIIHCFKGKPPQAAFKMARVIKDAKLYPSPLGLVPGQVLKVDKSYIIILPGPPREVETLLKSILEDLSGELKAKHKCIKTIYVKAKEAELASLLLDVIKIYGVYAKAIITQKGDKGLPIEILSFDDDKERCEQKIREVIEYIQKHLS